MADIKVYGAPWCPDCRQAKKFLSEHRIAYDWVDVDEDADGLRLVEEVQDGGHTIPTILFPDGSHLLEPSNDELARKLGLRLEAERAFYDLVIVGGGPAGLAAAIYAAREGIDSVVVEKSALGGQSGVTNRVDNYPGFPEGIDGAELADRFVAQARRYGVELLAAVAVERIAREGDDVVVDLASGQQVCAHAALIATGTAYRRLGAPGEEELIGAGVHFCATCDGPFYRGAEEVLVIGGGNSALEEAMFLTRFAHRVRIVARSQVRASRLLQDKVRDDPRFVVHTDTDIVELRGGKHLEEVIARDRATGQEHRWRPAAAFVFIGLDPNTRFLRGTVSLDDRGFVIAHRFQTSLPGVFVAGDVRAGSTKQLGSAVGDGIAALLMIRQYLEEHHQVAPHEPVMSQR